MGTQPDNVDTKFLKVVELRGDARQVTYPVAIRVFEGTWVDLVDDGFLPPLGFVTVDKLRFLAGRGGKR